MRHLLTATIFATFITPLAAQDFAKERLDKSPRHHEWVAVKNGNREVQCFVVYPEVKNKATAVLVIHENKGLTDWVRGVADQFAEAGYVAIAPDMLSGLGPNGGKTSDFASLDDATKALYKLPPDQVAGDLKAAADYVVKLPATNGKLAVAGFCWGGGQSFRFATMRPDLKAAFVFYGPPPAKEALAKDCVPHLRLLWRERRPHRRHHSWHHQADEGIEQDVRRRRFTPAPAMASCAPVRIPAGSQANRQARDEAWTRVKGF